MARTDRSCNPIFYCSDIFVDGGNEDDDDMAITKTKTMVMMKKMRCIVNARGGFCVRGQTSREDSALYAHTHQSTSTLASSL